MSRPTNKPPKKTKNKKTKERRSPLKPRNQNNGPADPFFGSATGQFEVGTTAIPVGPGNLAASILYLEAHQLIPSDYYFDPIRDREQVKTAAATLDKPDVTTAEFLRAIVILGHSPCSAALETLERWSNTDHPYASVARFALRECKWLIG